MTPSEREAAREMVSNWNSGESVPIGKPLDLLGLALDQIDADEGLMGRAIEALVVGGDYQADAWNDAKKLCADHGWHRTDAEKIQVAIDALRTRLGEESDDERE